MSRASCARYQLAPPGLSLTLAAFFKRTQVRMYPQRLFLPASLPSLTLILASHRRLLKRSQLSGFIELDKLSRQLSAGRGIGGRGRPRPTWRPTFWLDMDWPVEKGEWAILIYYYLR